MKCAYCKQKVDSDQEKCPNCGSSERESSQAYITDYGPFFYEGYIVWMTYDGLWPPDRASWYFYLGDKLIETITLDREVVFKFVPKGVSVMPFVWDLFKVAAGEKEVLRVQEQNTRRPAVFEIRCVSADEREEWLAGLTYTDVLIAAREGLFSG